MTWTFTRDLLAPPEEPLWPRCEWPRRKPVQEELRPVHHGRPASAPFGVTTESRTYWTSRAWSKRCGLPMDICERLAALYHRGSLLEPLAPRKEYEFLPSQSLRSIRQVRKVVRLDCDPLTRRRIEAGLVRGVRWIDGVGGVVAKT